MLIDVSNTGGDSENAFSFITNNDGKYLDIWGIDAIGADDQSSTSFADGTVHWAILTYEAASSTFTLYGIDAIGTAIEYSSGAIDYSVDYSDYTTGIGYHPDRPYKLNGLLVWNYNRFREDRLGYGFTEVLIEYSLNGTDFTTLDPIQF